MIVQLICIMGVDVEELDIVRDEMYTKFCFFILDFVLIFIVAPTSHQIDNCFFSYSIARFYLPKPKFCVLALADEELPLKPPWPVLMQKKEYESVGLIYLSVLLL